MRYALLAAVAALAGCGGGPKFVTVSGRVTLNGKPLPNVVVNFQPVAPQTGGDPGPGSSGVTDADGKFVLHSQFDELRIGAVIGKHTVRVAPVSGAGGEEDTDGRRKRKTVPAVASWYKATTVFTFDVPAGGSDQANFALAAP